MLIFVTNNCYNESQFIRTSDIVSLTCTYRNIECTSLSVCENNADSVFQHEDLDKDMDTPINQHQSAGISEYRGYSYSCKIILLLCEI